MANDWRDSDAHWILFSNFYRERTIPTLLAQPSSREQWERGLGETPEAAVRTFLEEGLLEEVKGDLADILGYAFGAEVLRRMCHERGLKASGKKRELALTLSQAVAPLVREAFELYATGTYTKIQVLKMITDKGLKTKRGRELTAQTFDALLRKPIYRGCVYSSSVAAHGEGLARAQS